MSPPPLPAEVTAARARAAVAYSMREQQDIEAAVVATGKVTAANFKRIVAMTNPRPGRPEEMEAIAKICDVPPRFMREGFTNLEALDLPEWAEHLEARMAELEARLPATPLDEEAADPPSDLGHELEEESPSEEDDDQSDESTGRGK